MLGHAGTVVVIVDDEQMSLQIACKVLQVRFLVALGITLRGVHVAFAVHDFIIAPVDDRSAGNTYFEYLRITEHQGGGHVSAKTPAMNTNTFTVHIRQALQEFNAFYLVFSLFYAETTEGDVLKFQPAVFTAAVVKSEHDVAFIRHVDVQPRIPVIQPLVTNWA